MKSVGGKKGTAGIWLGIFSASLIFNPTQSLGQETIPNQYIVVFKDQVDHAREKGVLKQTGESIRAASERLIELADMNDYVVNEKSTGQPKSVKNRLFRHYEHVLNGFSAELTTTAAKMISTMPEVDYVVPNNVVTASVVQAPTPSWGLDRIDEVALPLDGAFEYHADGNGVTAYIVDTGLRDTHAEFTGRVGSGFDTIDNDNTPQDCHGHGTHVAGTVLGTAFGVAKKATVVSVRVLGCNGVGSSASTIAGLNWIASNLRLPAVVNMSLLGGADAAIDQAVNNLVNLGVTVIVAAGNTNQDACNFSPARVPAAITVASTDVTDSRSVAFSNFGACIDVFAPGSSITSAWINSDTATLTISGTSMASPHVAGVAAMFLSTSPDASPAQTTVVITGSAVPNVVQNAGAGSPNLLLSSQISPLTVIQPPVVAAWLVPIVSFLLN